MSVIPEAMGDLAQAALTARAVEPAAGEGTEEGEGHTDEVACLNCGTALVGSHCHACGQAAHVHRTLASFFHDLLHGVFHFEGKVWRTLPLLAWNPGRLTREYIDGRRASYVSPIALFLFSVFLLFAAAQQFGGNITDFSAVDVNGTKMSGIAANEQELARLRTQRAQLVAQGKSTERLDGEIDGREQGLKVLKQVEAGATGAIEQASEQKRYSDVPEIDAMVRKAKANPALALFKLQSNAYKFSWALIPISVPFVWLLFPFSRRFRLYDHTVFVTYSLCFVSLLAVALLALRSLGVPYVVLAALAVPPWHIYRQLRGTYALGRFGALWRTSALLVVAMVTLMLFAALILLQSGH